MLIPPRNIQALACCAGACLQSFCTWGIFNRRKRGIFNRRKLGNIQSALTVSEDDRLAVSRIFRLVFDAVNEVAPGLKVLITEHADINDDWYQAAVVERWRGGLKLVPEDWPTN